MKNLRLFSGLMIALLFSIATANATVWRVNSAPGSDADYTSIQAAHDATTTLNGDTLYIEGAATGVGQLKTTKTLTIIGTGYFLGENPETQASPLGSTINGIWFNPGSEGTKVMGCYISSQVRFQTSNILITRCRIYYSSNTMILPNNQNLANIVITQSYISSSQTYFSAMDFDDVTNVLVSNCYIYGAITTNSNFSGIFTNNVFWGNVGPYNSVLKNNILYSGSFTDYNNNYSYNLSDGTDFGTANGNQANVSMSTVFVGTTGTSTDGAWELKSGSPAIGAGENGVDCGMFGGAFPYVLSGMPNIPAIYYLNTPPIPSDVIDVAIKAKSHN